MGWRGEVRRDERAMSAVETEWELLHARCPGATPFGSSAWQVSWWRAYGRAAALRLVLARRDGAVGALAALHVVRRAGLPVLVPVGAGISDWSDVLADPAAGDAALDALTRALLAEPGWHAVDLPEVRPGSVAERWAARWPGAVTRTDASVCAELAAGSLDDVLAGMSASARHGVRRALRKADAAGLRAVAVDAADTAAAVRRLLELHREQWRARGGMTPEHGRERFARHLTAAVAAMVPRGQARLVEYTLPGDPGAAVVAANLLLAGPDVVGGYLFGARPDLFGRFNVMAVLMRSALEAAADGGATTVSLLRGRETYKSAWPTAPVPNVRLVLARPGRPAARAYAAAVRARAGLVGQVRTRAPGLKERLLRARDLARNPGRVRGTRTRG